MNSKLAPLLTFFAAIAFIIVPCLATQGHYLVNGNISWLLIAAERLLNGQDLVQHIYETNPPLSILVYVPHIIFSKALGLPITVGAFYLTFLLVTLSTFTTYMIIKSFSFFTTSDKRIFVLGYLLSVTLAMTVFFSEREHLVILALVPFILCQYAMTRHIEIPKTILIPVMIIGAIGILIKPHYGLLPTVFLIDRMIRQKRFNIFFDIDFMTLSIMTLAYIGMIFTFFHSYTEIIFPDVLTLYATTTQPIIVIRSIQTYMYAALILCILEVFQNDLSQQKKNFLLFLYSCALLCLIPYFVQMKGFFNHVLPVYTFLICAMSLSIGFRIPRLFKHLEIAHIIVPLVCLSFIVQVQTPLNKRFPKQTDIPNLPVARFLEKECQKPCTFFAFHGNIETINPTAAYMGYTHGTRFPSFWFIPKILTGVNSENTEERAYYQNLKNKYTQFVADDLLYYKPSIMIIAKELQIGAPTPFNFMDFFKENDDLRTIFEQDYEKDGEFEFDNAEYFTGTTLEYTNILTYDIYRRKSVNP